MATVTRIDRLAHRTFGLPRIVRRIVAVLTDPQAHAAEGQLLREHPGPMPPAFPTTEFRAFGQAAVRFFPELLSDAALFDPQERRRHFEWSWQAVRYRYRSCAECQDEFVALLANASEAWRAGLPDEELTYKLERCIYVFFMAALSVFDSFAFCLYYLGHAVQPVAFADVGNPRKITRGATARAYGAAFPQATITRLLAELPDDAGFSNIDAVRNLVGHRISGRRSVATSGTVHADGTHTKTGARKHGRYPALTESSRSMSKCFSVPWTTSPAW